MLINTVVIQISDYVIPCECKCFDYINSLYKLALVYIIYL